MDAALLTIAGARRQVTRYLRHLARAGLAALDGGQYTITPGALPDRADAPADIPGVPPDGAGYNLYPLRYAWNEAYEMLAAAGMLPAVAPPPVYSAGAGAATDRAAAERMGSLGPKTPNRSASPEIAPANHRRMPRIVTLLRRVDERPARWRVRVSRLSYSAGATASTGCAGAGPAGRGEPKKA